MPVSSPMIVKFQFQSDLDYEKATNARLTQEIRRFQSNALDATVIQPRVSSAESKTSAAGTNTSLATPDSPVWSSGSGAIKEIRLHEAEMKVILGCSLKSRSHDDNRPSDWSGPRLELNGIYSVVILVIVVCSATFIVRPAVH